MKNHKPIRLLGKIVRERRKEKGLSQAMLAYLLYIETSYISDLEKGVNIQTIPFGSLIDFARVLDMSVFDLVGQLGIEDNETSFNKCFIKTY